MNPFCSSMIPGGMASGMGTRGDSTSPIGHILDMLPQGMPSKAGMSTPGQPTQQPQQGRNYADPSAQAWYQQNNPSPSSGGPGMTSPGQRSPNYATPSAQNWYNQNPFGPAGG